MCLREGANFLARSSYGSSEPWCSRPLICCIDGLKGSDAIQSVFPESSVQLCIVHRYAISSSMLAVASFFIKDLRTVYGAVNKDSAAANLDLSLWGEMYPIVIKSWRDNWERLMSISNILQPSVNSFIRPIRLRGITDR